MANPEAAGTIKMTLVQLAIVSFRQTPVLNRRGFFTLSTARKLRPAIFSVALWCGVFGWLMVVSTPAQAATPLAATQPATLITSTSATLNGMAVPNGEACVAWFEWGARGGYGQATSPVAVGNGSGVVRVSAGISGLTNAGVYQFRLVVSNATGVARGAAQVFTTGKPVTIWGGYYPGATPVPSGLSDIVAAAAGEYQSLALKTDGTVAHWSDDSAGVYWTGGALERRFCRRLLDAAGFK
jgi:hypothetical protein